jgi:hypothetical protein
MIMTISTTLTMVMAMVLGYGNDHDGTVNGTKPPLSALFHTTNHDFSNPNYK